MASKAPGPEQAFGPVLTALTTLQGHSSRSEKAQAHDFLEKFQKSVLLAYSPKNRSLFCPHVF